MNINKPTHPRETFDIKDKDKTEKKKKKKRRKQRPYREMETSGKKNVSLLRKTEHIISINKNWIMKKK